MKEQSRYFGSSLIREITDQEIQAVSGGVLLPVGSEAETDTGTDNGYSCDHDTDWVRNIG